MTGWNAGAMRSLRNSSVSQPRLSVNFLSGTHFTSWIGHGSAIFGRATFIG